MISIGSCSIILAFERCSGSGGDRAFDYLVCPATLWMDEPLTNLDFLLRAQMRLELKRIQQELNQTVLPQTLSCTSDECFLSSLVFIPLDDKDNRGPFCPG